MKVWVVKVWVMKVWGVKVWFYGFVVLEKRCLLHFGSCIVRHTTAANNNVDDDKLPVWLFRAVPCCSIACSIDRLLVANRPTDQPTDPTVR